MGEAGESSSFIKNFLSGSIAGIVGRTIVAPIDRVKLLLQVQATLKSLPDNQAYKSMTDCFVRIYREEGLLAFWRGHLVNVGRYFPVQACNLAFYDMYKQAFLEGVEMETQFRRYVVGNFASGAAAGATTLTCVYPLSLARTRLAVDVGKDSTQREFKGLLDFLGKILKANGVIGLYRGFSVSFPSVFLYRGI